MCGLAGRSDYPTCQPVRRPIHTSLVKQPGYEIGLSSGEVFVWRGMSHSTSVGPAVCLDLCAACSRIFGATRTHVPYKTYKTHMYLHATECKGYRNVSYYSTWMDEDWLKKISKTMKLTSLKTAQHRVLERWILAIPFNLKKVENLDGWPVPHHAPTEKRKGLQPPVYMHRWSHGQIWTQDTSQNKILTKCFNICCGILLCGICSCAFVFRIFALPSS